MIWVIFSELSRCMKYVQSLPKKKLLKKKSQDFVETLIGAYLNPVIVGKVIITILEKALVFAFMIHYFPAFWYLYPKNLFEDFFFLFQVEILHKNNNTHTQEAGGNSPTTSPPRSWFVWTICFSSVNMVEASGNRDRAGWGTWSIFGDLNGDTKSWLFFFESFAYNCQFRWERKKELKILISLHQNPGLYTLILLSFRENYGDIKWNLDVHPSSKRKKVANQMHPKKIQWSLITIGESSAESRWQYGSGHLSETFFFGVFQVGWKNEKDVGLVKL